MKKTQITAIFTALAVAVFASALTGCAGREYTIGADGTAVTTTSTVETAPVTETSTATDTQESSEESSEAESSAEEESSEAELSAEESSEEESSEAESSAEESSEEESSEAESSAEESSEEESSEGESSEEVTGAKVTFVKPEKWNDDLYAYVYDGDNNEAEWPGTPMTDNGDGTFSYIVDVDMDNPLIIFNANGGRRQYPLTTGLEVVDGKTYEQE